MRGSHDQSKKVRGENCHGGGLPGKSKALAPTSFDLIRLWLKIETSSAIGEIEARRIVPLPRPRWCNKSGWLKVVEPHFYHVDRCPHLEPLLEIHLLMHQTHTCLIYSMI